MTHAPDEYDTLPITQQLVLEVLAARTRLGEKLWTFPAGAQRALNLLESRGLVTQMHGTVERTVRASLTDAGRALALDPDYTPPAQRAPVLRATEHGARGVRWWIAVPA